MSDERREYICRWAPDDAPERYYDGIFYVTIPRDSAHRCTLAEAVRTLAEDAEDVMIEWVGPETPAVTSAQKTKLANALGRLSQADVALIDALLIKADNCDADQYFQWLRIRRFAEAALHAVGRA